MSNLDRFSIKYFYTTGSECTASLSAVNACLSQSYNTTIYKYEISSSTDVHPSSKRMSEKLQIKYIPTFVLEMYPYPDTGSRARLGMEFSRIREYGGYRVTQNEINGWFNHYSSSGGN